MKTKISVPFTNAVENATGRIRFEMERRNVLAANELRNASQLVLRGQRSGRRYKVPGTYRRQKDTARNKIRRGRYYTASAPGEPPAVRTGVFRLSWQPTAQVVFGHYIARIESDLRTEDGRYNLAEILEDGTEKMEPRPYQDRILQRAEPRIVRIYSQPYF